MPIVFAATYLVVGFVQMFAIADGVQFATEWPALVGWVIAVLTSYVPLLGAALGIYGAVNAWDWSMAQSVMLFLWYVPFAIVIALLVRAG